LPTATAEAAAAYCMSYEGNCGNAAISLNGTIPVTLHASNKLKHIMNSLMTSLLMAMLLAMFALRRSLKFSFTSHKNSFHECRIRNLVLALNC